MSQKKKDAAIYKKWKERHEAAGVTPVLLGYSDEDKAVLRHLSRLLSSGAFDVEVSNIIVSAND